jgi:curved DNA-binding protein CbpA
MPTHYETLGVRVDASMDDIRTAYRALARRMHPDATATGSAASGAVGRGSAERDMASVNEAWRVLSDPGRRAMYDASLRSPVTVPSSRAPSQSAPAPFAERAPSGKFPKWPFVMLFVLAVIFIITAGALYQPSKPAKPDNLLFTGSCVLLEPNRDAVEVGCETPHDAVVVTVVNFDAACPMETETYRDRQGRGYACVNKVP